MGGHRQPLNFFTLDIEEWYHANYDGIDPSSYRGKSSNLVSSNLEPLIDRLIDLCGEHRVRATCFVLGVVGEQTPSVVKKLHAAGHEIASHGYAHLSVFRMTPNQFRADVKRSCDILEDLTGEKVLGFRAPSFSVKRETLEWFYPALESLGLRYSSSVFPGRTFLYGIPGFPPQAHYPLVNGVQQTIMEFPVPCLNILGFQMGLYPRLFPAWMIRRIIAAANEKGNPVVLYAHPREIDINQPRLPLPPAQKLIHYWGIRSCERKLRTILREGAGGFGCLREVCREH
jgi:polysaccharide deacetylase family protein (PEP-CTERM system associated)